MSQELNLRRQVAEQIVTKIQEEIRTKKAELIQAQSKRESAQEAFQHEHATLSQTCQELERAVLSIECLRIR